MVVGVSRRTRGDSRPTDLRFPAGQGRLAARLVSGPIDTRVCVLGASSGRRHTAIDLSGNCSLHRSSNDDLSDLARSSELVVSVTAVNTKTGPLAEATIIDRDGCRRISVYGIDRIEIRGDYGADAAAIPAQSRY